MVMTFITVTSVNSFQVFEDILCIIQAPLALGVVHACISQGEAKLQSSVTTQLTALRSVLLMSMPPQDSPD